MSSVSAPSPPRSWREDAVRIVEELFHFAPVESWDLLLDLREGIRRGEDWDGTLDLFLLCRERLEADHYLPFYRLRRLLAESLRLECGRGGPPVTSLRQVLARHHRSFADIRKAVTREVFEHDLSAPESGTPVRVVERSTVGR